MMNFRARPGVLEGHVDALVVDVGGGVGNHTLALARAYPRLRFVVQDRERVCEMGEEASVAVRLSWMC